MSWSYSARQLDLELPIRGGLPAAAAAAVDDPHGRHVDRLPCGARGLLGGVAHGRRPARHGAVLEGVEASPRMGSAWSYNSCDIRTYMDEHVDIYNANTYITFIYVYYIYAY